MTSDSNDPGSQPGIDGEQPVEVNEASNESQEAPADTQTAQLPPAPPAEESFDSPMAPPAAPPLAPPLPQSSIPAPAPASFDAQAPVSFGAPAPAPVAFGAPAPALSAPAAYGAPVAQAAPAAYGVPAVTPAGYGAPAQPAAPRQPMSPRGKRALIASLVSVGVVGLLIGGAAITLSIMNGARGPETAVKEYLTLIADGKAQAANELVDPDRSSNESVLLTDEVLGAASERIQVVKVETLDRQGELAAVEATMELEGDRFTQVFQVKQGPKEFLFLDTWELQQPLVSPLYIGGESGIEEVFVNGKSVKLKDGDGMFYVYPAIYEVGTTESKYFTSEKETLTVQANGSGDVFLIREPSTAFKDAIKAQAEQAIKACVTVPTNMEEYCPYTVRNKSLTSMEYSKPFGKIDYLTSDAFETEAFELSVRGKDDAATDPAQTRRYYLFGDIEWKNGEPIIKNYYIY